MPAPGASASLLRSGKVRAFTPQFGDALPGVKIGPIDERKIGDLAQVIRTIRNVDHLAGDMNGTDSAFVLQQPDVAQWREVERNEIGGPARFEHTNAIAFGMKPALISVAARNASAGVNPRSSTPSRPAASSTVPMA
jgi:hypothetical protein